ncbi:MAG TPA: primase-helicase family protein [Stellaceae bacterium]|nr:primase-helicase family protein [Stellaceae bacterium]
MADVIGSTDAAIAFLRWFRPGGPWVLSCDGQGFPTRTFDNLDEAAAWIDERQGKRNIYFTPAEVKAPVAEKTVKTDIACSWWVWAEVDPAKSVSERPALLKRLRDFTPCPTVIVDSGGGYWGFWRLGKPVSPDECERLCAIARDAVAGDHVHNCDRVARLPGTVNLPNENKQKKGQQTALARAGKFRGEPYTVADIEAAATTALPAVASSGAERKGEPDHTRSGLLLALAGKVVRAGKTYTDYWTAVYEDAELTAKVEENPRELDRAWRKALRDHKAESSWAADWVYLSHAGHFFNVKTKDMQPPDKFNLAHAEHVKSKAAIYIRQTLKCPVYYDAAYAPALGETFVMDERQYVNTYSEEGIPSATPFDGLTDDDSAVLIVRDHIYKLIGDDREAALFISWLAYIVQTRERPNWAVVLQSVQGAGKGALVKLMAKVLGPRNLKTVSGPIVTGSSFNGWAHGSLLCVVEEIRLSGENRLAALERFKTLITDPSIYINEKNRPMFSAPNTQAYWFNTNHKDAMPVGDDDRRYAILMSPLQSKEQLPDKAYFDRLNAAIENHIGALRCWLLTYPLHPEFNAKGRAPETTGRDRMRSFSHTEEERLLREWIEDGSRDGITPEVIVTSAVTKALAKENDEIEPSSITVTALLKRLGYEPLPNSIRIDGSKERVRVRDLRRWPSNPDERNKEIRDYLAACQAL